MSANSNGSQPYREPYRMRRYGPFSLRVPARRVTCRDPYRVRCYDLPFDWHAVDRGRDHAT